MNRFDTALQIQCGASNPKGICNTLLQVMNNPDLGGTDNIRQDPACRLIVHQLASLFNVYAIDHDMDEYTKLTEYCEDRRNE